MEFSEQNLEFEYPCPWTYRMIGADEFAMRTVVGELLGDTEYTLVYVQSSRTGKYCSLQLDLVVQSEEHRKGLFTTLGQSPAIRAIL